MKSHRRLLGVVAGVAAFLATGALALAGHGGPASERLAGSLGPEGVPLPAAAPLGAPRPLTPGAVVDGISCDTEEQVAFHIHAHLAIFVHGRARQIPAGVGVGVPYTEQRTGAGRFVDRASCFAWLHTHAADGILHVESPDERRYRLGEFFDLWGQPLSRTQVGPARGRVTAIVDGRVVAGSPRAITLARHEQITLAVGRPVVVPAEITFPVGL